MLGQQFAGINSIIFYGVKILNGMFPEASILINCMVSVSNMVITLIASLFLDRLGRIPLLLTSLGLMGFASVGLSVGVLFDNSALTVLSIFSYVGSFAIGCGPIPFLYVSEVSQIEVKDLAQSWATDCNWASVFVIGSIFPPLNAWIGGYTYFLFAGVCFLFFAYAKVSFPETKGKQTYADVWKHYDRDD
ncbi:unnamed protein product [Ambrosiozyma monospora]|uniref:Unnamed protein product n=1 Tax=Ambrosiozyma monospora TaxID=43982 RepID=A0A9W7DHT3_AMBMO|nr:unnamed protein product [Ambrosiozyma monospora]